MRQLDMSATAVTKEKSSPRDKHHRSVHNYEDWSIFKTSPDESSSAQVACVTTSAFTTATSTQNVDVSCFLIYLFFFN